MSLYVNDTDVKDYQTYCRRPADDGPDGYWQFQALTWVLALTTMNIGLREITLQNWTDFYGRVSMLQRLRGPLLTTAEGEPYYITAEDVYRHIGLKTNGCKPTTKTAFYALLGKNAMRDAEERAEEWAKKNERPLYVAPPKKPRNAKSRTGATRHAQP